MRTDQTTVSQAETMHSRNGVPASYDAGRPRSKRTEAPDLDGIQIEKNGQKNFRRSQTEHSRPWLAPLLTPFLPL